MMHLSRDACRTSSSSVCFAGFVGTVALFVVFFNFVQSVPVAVDRTRLVVGGLQDTPGSGWGQVLTNGVGVESFRSADGEMANFTFTLIDHSTRTIDGWSVYPLNAAVCRASNGVLPLTLMLNAPYSVICNRTGTSGVPPVVTVLTSVGPVHGVLGPGHTVLAGSAQLQRATAIPDAVHISPNFELSFDITPAGTVKGASRVLRLGKYGGQCESHPSDGLPSFTFQDDTTKLTVCMGVPGEDFRFCNDVQEALPVGITSRITCRLVGDGLAIEINGRTADSGWAFFPGFNGQKFAGDETVLVWISDDCGDTADAVVGHVTYIPLN